MATRTIVRLMELTEEASVVVGACVADSVVETVSGIVLVSTRLVTDLPSIVELRGASVVEVLLGGSLVEELATGASVVVDVVVSKES